MRLANHSMLSHDKCKQYAILRYYSVVTNIATIPSNILMVERDHDFHKNLNSYDETIFNMNTMFLD